MDYRATTSCVRGFGMALVAIRKQPIKKCLDLRVGLLERRIRVDGVVRAGHLILGYGVRNQCVIDANGVSSALGLGARCGRVIVS